MVIQVQSISLKTLNALIMRGYTVIIKGGKSCVRQSK
jgi:hypothetical protein